jgi:serine phosphatase RsbU (regulator of sigma subunit)
VLSWANGGHPPALLRHEGETAELDLTGPLLGILPGATYGHGERVLSVGDCLALFSDGLTEAHAPDGSLWGSDGVAGALATADGTVSERAARVLDAANAFRGGAASGDDVTLLLAAVRVAPSWEELSGPGPPLHAADACGSVAPEPRMR